MVDTSALVSNVARLSRHTLADQVYADIKELIFAGQIPPGEKVTLRGLAAALGTSAMPVRDAVSRLVSDKALDMLPNRTVQVSWPSPERFEEIVLIRSDLEGLAAELAAERRTAGDLAQIEDLATRFDELVAPDRFDGSGAIRANRLFHFAVYDAAKSPILREMIEALWLQIGPVLAFSITDAQSSGMRWWDVPKAVSGGKPNGSRESTHRLHHDLVDALAARDGAAARRAIAGDIREASTKIIQSGRLSHGADTTG